MSATPIRVIVIQPDGSFKAEYIKPELDTIQGIVGGFFEDSHTARAVFLFNECAKDQKMRINEMATYLWWKMRPEMEGIDCLAGPVIVTGPADSGEFTDIDIAIVDLFEAMSKVTAGQAP